GVLIRRGHDRRDVVDARVVRPRHLHPDAIADRHPVPVAGRAPPLLWRGSDPGVEVVLARAALKDPVSHLSLPLTLPDSSRPVILPHGQSPPFVLKANLMGAPGGWRTDGNQRSGGWVAQLRDRGAAPYGGRRRPRSSTTGTNSSR